MKPSDETLRLFGISPEDRQRNVDQQDRQLATLVEMAEAARETEAEPAPVGEPATDAVTSAAPEPDDTEARTERALLRWELDGVLRAALRRFSPREEPGKA